MKKLLIVLIAGLLYGPLAEAQNAGITGMPFPQRRISFNFIGKDSVNLALNEDFDMIEDSCSQVIRYGHLSMRERKYFGPIKDVSKLNPQLVLTEGNYNTEGKKDGYFTTRFVNGNLQAKGAFKNGLYDGKWEVYYDDNKPRLLFEASGNDITLKEAWDAKGNKIIDNGKGSYRVDLGPIYWKGKLLNGRPDGTWRAMKTDDASNTEVLSESFKNGAFQKGNGPLGAYTDASRLTLVAPDMLPFTRAELLHMSIVPCNGTKRKHIVYAQYRNGLADFSDHIKTLASEALRGVDLGSLNNTELIMNGEVATNGNIIKLNPQNTLNDRIARLLIQQFYRLPPLQPATVDGKPVEQKFAITFTFSQGLYRFNYRFLPLDVK